MCAVSRWNFGVNGPISAPVRALRPRRLLLGLLAAAAASSCSHSPWPDEPGVAVELVRAKNVDAADRFLTALTNRRRAANRAEPSVAPRYQDEIRTFAEDLQAGKISVADAEQAVKKWARAAYGRDVKTFALDCSAGASMQLPDALVATPFVVISFAAAHFRPRSLAKPQCAILMTALVGSERVEGTKL
jgi:hypothetical protein